MGVLDIAHRPFQSTLAAAEGLGGVDLILTSPPYPSARPGHYGGEASTDFVWEDYQELGDLVARALKPGGFCALDGGRHRKIANEPEDQAVGLALIGFFSAHAADALRIHRNVKVTLDC